jgi:dephospho-CoA kinase
VNEAHLQALFSHAYILGGSPCSGKSTIAEMLSKRYQLPYYKVDDHDAAHFQRCQPEKQPVMFKYSKVLNRIQGAGQKRVGKMSV